MVAMLRKKTQGAHGKCGRMRAADWCAPQQTLSVPLACSVAVTLANPQLLDAASIETLNARLDGLVSDIKTATEQSHSAEHAELRSIRAEYEAAVKATSASERALQSVEGRKIELQTALQQHNSALGKLERRRKQLADELESGENSMRSAESGVHEAKGVAEGVLVAMKQKVHELEEVAADQETMKELYANQITQLEQEVAQLQEDAESRIDQPSLKRALFEFAASSDFETYFPILSEALRLTPSEARRCRAQRQMRLDQDPADPK